MKTLLRFTTPFWGLALMIQSGSSYGCPVTHFQKQMSLVETREQIVETSTITEQDFDRLVETISETYTSIFKKQGLNLKIEADWKNKQPNAFSDQSGKNRYVYLYGGYARHPLMDQDTFLSIICHEIGHHLGGFPRESGSSWASAEGQADYFSTLKCMKVALKDNIENERVALSLDLPTEVKDQCRSQHLEDDDYFICLRSAKASENYGKVNSSLATPDSTAVISLLTPVKRRVFSTNLSYPTPQCRTDTKFQGALCNASIDIPLGFDDENKGACSSKNSKPIGARPNCWFLAKP
jgi:hypothetical protein